jgi:hypothetical protein
MVKLIRVSSVRLESKQIIQYYIMYTVPFNTHHITELPLSRSRVTDEITPGLH